MYLLLLVLFHVERASGASWYKFYLMRNAGLQAQLALTADDCKGQCRNTTGCSAISYQQDSNTCLLSVCNQLDLVKNTGWNTYVLLNTYVVEPKSLPTIDFEWMLTDSCGLSNMGQTFGPKMNLFGTSSGSSQSVYAGNAVYFAGTNSSYGQSDANPVLNNPLGTNSFTVMMWYKWTSAQIQTSCFNSACNLFLEFWQGGTRGIVFWYHHFGTYISVGQGTTGCSANCATTRYTFTPVLNSWYHYAIVYNATENTFSVYLNQALVAYYSVGPVTNNLIWDTVRIGYTTFDNRSLFNGFMYCVKYTDYALTASQVAFLAEACNTGKIRFS